MRGDNQQGKTFFEDYLQKGIARGCWPEEDLKKVGTHLWGKYGMGNGPKYIRWVSNVWEGRIKTQIVDQTLVPNWPDSWPVKKKTNSLSIPYIWEYDNGSKVQLMPYSAGRSSFEGLRSHLVLIDEPCPEDCWAAIVRQIIAFKGIIFIGASIVNMSEIWMEELFPKTDIDKKVFVLESSIKDNIGYGVSKEEIDDVKGSMSKEEAERRFGLKSLLSSIRVLKIQDKHFIPRFKIPYTYYVSAAIDVGQAKGHDALFIAQSPDGVRYCCFDLYCENTEEFAYRFVEIVTRYKLRMDPHVLIDPAAKSDKNHDLTTWGQIEKIINPFRMTLKTAQKFKDEGARLINSALAPMDHIPKLYIFDDLKRTSIQLRGIKYKDGLIYKPRPKEEPQDDAFENLYRLMLDNSPFANYGNKDKKEIYIPKNRNPVTGY